MKNEQRRQAMENEIDGYLVATGRPVPMVIVVMLAARNATVVQVSASKFTETGLVYEFVAADSAKREQGDVYDPLTGELLATGRAFQRLGRDMIRAAGKRVRASSAKQDVPRCWPRPRAQAQHRTLTEWKAIQAAAAAAEEHRVVVEDVSFAPAIEQPASTASEYRSRVATADRDVASDSAAYQYLLERDIQEAVGNMSVNELAGAIEQAQKKLEP